MTEIRITGKHFAKAVNYAKRAGGTYRPGTKTWNIPDACNMLNAPRLYGWELSPGARRTQRRPAPAAGHTAAMTV